MRDWRFNHIDFSTYPHYAGDDLGVFWAPEKTTIKIWAPTAKIVEFRLYKDGQHGEEFHKTQLQPDGDGTWSTVLMGDYEGKFYTFRINDGNWLAEAPDIYAGCVGVNGLRGMIFNPLLTDPPGWESDLNPKIDHITDAVIWETHIRDFSIGNSSGMSAKGQYLAFTEKETTTPEGISTGISHLLELGITHVHLLPVNDFYTVDEERPFEKYNWGYDPLHFNAPEGSFASDPYDGTTRIKELKMLVQSLHSHGIGVILDVVYNHTYFAKESVFNQFIPGYFYRQKQDGTFANASGCGNEIATERSMVRKYIIDSLKYWVETYHIDGFRFDLMGIFDIKTMQEIRKELPGVILYGEGWTADYSPMSEEFRAVKRNMNLLPGIAAFNDDFRIAVKGNYESKKSKGFVSGLELREEAVKFGIVAAVSHPQIIYDYVETSKQAWAIEPGQTINYIACHDNHTLWDKLKLSCPKASDEEMRKMVKLAAALLLTSQGVPFLHSGIEFCRTKGGNPNSYRSPDSVNQIDWSRKGDYLDVFIWFQKLIKLRREHPAFRMHDSNTIRKNISFCADDYIPGVICYSIDGTSVGDEWGKMLLIFNGSRKSINRTLPEGRYRVAVYKDFISDLQHAEVVIGTVDVDATSVMILVKEIE